MITAIVSTTKEFTEDHNYFLRHHLLIGVRRFFLFLDDPDAKRSIDLLDIPPEANVSIIIRDEKLEKRWQSFPEFATYQEDIDKLVVKRQALNVRVAEEMAFEENISWLFHIDDDELLVSPGWKNIQDYLFFLPPEVKQVTALNLEALYTKNLHQGIFNKGLRFKKNPYLMAGSQLELIIMGPKKYFYCSYAHGKSAIRLSSLNGQSQIPAGVHLFNERSAETYFQASPFDLVVLHFPFSGSKKLYQKFQGINRRRIYQYEHLAAKTEVNFYTEARLLESAQEFDDFYEKHVLYKDDEVEYLQKHNLISELKLEY